MTIPAIQNLIDHQRQLDMDGCEVGVSRQALDEALAHIRTLERALDKAEVALAPFVQTYREFLKPNPFADQSSSTFKEFQAADEALTALRASREPLDHDGEG